MRWLAHLPLRLQRSGFSVISIIHVAPPLRNEPRSKHRKAGWWTVGSCKARSNWLNLFRSAEAAWGHKRWWPSKSRKTMSTKDKRSGASSFAAWWRAVVCLDFGSWIERSAKRIVPDKSEGSSRSRLQAQISSPGRNNAPHARSQTTSKLQPTPHSGQWNHCTQDRGRHSHVMLTRLRIA